MVAKKDVHMPKHPELVDKNVPNLHVMKAMQVWSEGGTAGRRGRCVPVNKHRQALTNKHGHMFIKHWSEILNDGEAQT